MVPLMGDKERFYRLARVILDDVCNQFRTMFKDKFQKRFKYTWGEFRAPLPHITDVMRQRDTAQFDPTALFTGLLYSRTGILGPSPRRPNAKIPPVQDSKRIDELREMRNEFAYTNSASLSPANVYSCVCVFSEKLKTALRHSYLDLTKPVQESVDVDSVTQAAFGDKFVELRIQRPSRTKSQKRLVVILWLNTASHAVK